MTEAFLLELLASIFIYPDVAGMGIKNLKYSYLKTEEHKAIWKAIKNHHSITGRIPTIGIVSQKIDDGSDVGNKALDILADISIMKPVREDVISSFEGAIRESMSVEFFDRFCEEMNSGNPEKAQKLMGEYSEKISSVSLKHDRVESVFGGFNDRLHMNYVDTARNGEPEKIATGIDPFDYHTKGGIERTEIGCMMMRSGVGKSKFLKEVGINSVLMSSTSVLHIQAEGTKKSCLIGYDSAWTACIPDDLKRGEIGDRHTNLTKRIREIINQRKGDIYVHAFEQFNTASMYDVYDIAREMVKRYPIGLIVMDYLELIDPANGIKYSPNDERHRRLAIANDFKNICVELNVGGWTATQANDIPPKLLNDPAFVITRNNTSECKSLINPFSYFLTGNQTSDEYDDGMMRIHHDKLRDYKANQTYAIYQDYDRGKFYDRKRSREFLDESGEIKIFHRDE